MYDHQYGKLIYGSDKPHQLYYHYKEKIFILTSNIYEPCLYIEDGDKIICTLHTAFTTEELIKAFSAGKAVKAIDRNDYDEAAFCRIVAAAIDSKREQMDFTYAAEMTANIP